MNDELNWKNDTSGFWDGLGTGLMIFLLCFGVGTCQFLANSKFVIEKPKKQNVEKVDTAKSVD